jgi:hypothetical protein
VKASVPGGSIFAKPEIGFVKAPLDSTPYAQDSRSKPIHASVPDGGYVYVRDVNGVIFVLPDGLHMHPLVLGGGQWAMYAGDMTIRGQKVVDLTNLSGTFQFDDEAGLKAVAAEIRQQGLAIEPGAVRLFPSDGSRPVIVE